MTKIYFNKFGEIASGYGSEKNIKDFYQLRQECLGAGKLFEDPEFLADDNSLYHSHRPDYDIKWLRPKEISSEPDFFVEGASRFDVGQGYLEDCWLLAAVASLTLDKKLFSRVVCDDNGFDKNYAGIFHFR